MSRYLTYRIGFITIKVFTVVTIYQLSINLSYICLVKG